VTDGSQETSSTLTIHLLPRHEIKPVAVNDGATVDAAGAAAGNVLANDTDVNHDTLYVRSADTTKVGAGVTHIAGEYGVLTIAADGDYTYQVDPTKVSAGEAALSDTFSYKISDGTLQDTGSLTIHINPDGLVMSPDFHI
jgi:VCBS repeat-containing protein